MGVVQNIIGMVRDINDHRENAKIRDVLKNNLNNPDAAVQAVAQINPIKAQSLATDFAKLDADRAANEKAKFDNRMGRLGLAFKMLRTAPHDQIGAAFDRMTPLFVKELGVDPTELEAYKQQAIADPNFLAGLDDKAYEALYKDQHTSTVAPAGSDVLRGGEVVDRVPYGYKPVTVGSAQTGYTASAFDPNRGTFGQPSGAPSRDAAPGAPAPADMATPGAPAPASSGWSDPGATQGLLSVEALRPHFIQQESGGDYTRVNSDTGALGAYQVMPDTGRAIARQLGLAWRPDMMKRDDPTSRRYQDAIGGEAIQESIDHSGGDLGNVFSYYYGGPNRAEWGPKTAQYTAEMKSRVGLGRADGQAATVSPSGITVPAAPPKPQKTARMLSPEEVRAAGYPDGTVVQEDSTGAQKVTYHPPAAKAGKDPDALRANYEDAKANIAELRNNITQLINDPDLGYATGTLGSAMEFIPGSARQRMNSRIKQINTQKLMSMVTSLKAGGGNPFTRITNYEAQILPSTLGDFNLKQNKDDFISVGRKAITQLNDLEKRLDAGAAKSGWLQQASAPANAPAVGEVRKGYRFKGGDPASPSSWEKVK